VNYPSTVWSFLHQELQCSSPVTLQVDERRGIRLHDLLDELVVNLVAGRKEREGFLRVVQEELCVDLRNLVSMMSKTILGRHERHTMHRISAGSRINGNMSAV